MASESNQTHPPKRDESAGQSSSPHGNHHAPPPVVYQHAMGYPYPPQGQPGSYPPTEGYHPGYPYPNGYDNYNYYNHSQYPPSQGQGQGQTSRFTRGVIIGIITVIILMCATSLIVWLILRPTVPKFHVETFSVSNFNTSSPTSFTATWDANLTVRNPNTRLNVYFDRIEAFIYYDVDNLLASSFAQPFNLDTKTSGSMRTRLTANTTDQPVVPTWVVQKIDKDMTVNGGNVAFSLSIGILTTFKSGSWWIRHTVLRVFCEDLKVAFNQGNGNLVNANNRDCEVYV